jgi:hypothetical protein
MVDIVTAAINFAALIFLAAQVMLARNALRDSSKSQEEEWGRRRRKAAIDMSMSMSAYRASLSAALPWNDRSAEEVAAFLKEADGQHVKLEPVRQYLNHLEDVAVGVKQNVFDIDTIYMLDGRRIIDTVANYMPYILGVRKELDRPNIYDDIEDLAALLKNHGARASARCSSETVLGGRGRDHPGPPDHLDDDRENPGRRDL